MRIACAMMCSISKSRSESENAKSRDARGGQRERTAEMHDREGAARPIFAVEQQLSHFGGKRRKRGETAEEARDREKPQVRRQVLARREERHRESDEIAADEIRSDRAERELRHAG